MKFFSKSLLILSLFIVMTFPIYAQSKTTWAEKGKSYLEYTMHHTLHDFSGKNDKVNCIIAYDPATVDIQKVSVSANISDFNSGSGNRDSHVLEVAEAIKYPKIKFSSNKIEKKGNTLLIKGLLNFHGVTKEKTIEATEDLSGKKLHVKGSFSVGQEEFDIKRETFMMVPVDDNIDVKFDIFFPVENLENIHP